MLDEEKKAIEQAISSVTRGVDIESAMLILEKCVLDGLIITRGRINIFKIAVRQIVVFLKEYKDKGYLDVVREKVKANETVEKQSKEIEELKEDSCCMTNCVRRDKEKLFLEDKIKVKIEELNDGIKRDMINHDKLKDESWKLAIHRSMAQKIEIKKVLQSLLEKE